ncbi:hypothetical protein DY000_02005180 [Brassica cretica]|uniref:Uncharacterized protein n=1 Tax=Brassica cretica TaxID=69181 RepID=A0ABQ7C3U8_BRACR|nr:hypothetical protein DY000_02005180 [Brassica cretica]
MLSLLRRKKAEGLSVSFSTSPSSRLNLVVSLVLILGVSLESRRLSRISSSLSNLIVSLVSNLVVSLESRLTSRLNLLIEVMMKVRRDKLQEKARMEGRI